MDRTTKERKLIALMISDLELDLTEPELIELEQEVRSLPEEELDRTLASRLSLSYPAGEQAMQQALSHVEEPKILHAGEASSVSGTTATSDEPPSPGEHEG